MSKLTKYKFKLSGFSLIELLMYVVIFSVISAAVWRSIQWMQTRQISIKEMQNISSTANRALNILNREIAKSESAAKILTPPSGNATFSQNLNCIELSQYQAGTIVPSSFWLGLDNQTNLYALYWLKSSGCNSNSTTSNFVKLSEPLFEKIETNKPFFIGAGDTTKINLRVNLTKNGIPYRINYDQAQTAINFAKLDNKTGCQITTPAESWFSAFGNDTFRYMYIVFSQNYADNFDRLEVEGLSSCSGNSTGSGNIGNRTFSCQFCSNASSRTSPSTCRTADRNLNGYLYLDAGNSVSRDVWVNTLSQVKYRPQNSNMTINPNNETQSIRMMTYMVSSSPNILNATVTKGTNQGSVLLNLYKLSKSCPHPNFSN